MHWILLFCGFLIEAKAIGGSTRYTYIVRLSARKKIRSAEVPFLLLSSSSVTSLEFSLIPCVINNNSPTALLSTTRSIFLFSISKQRNVKSPRIVNENLGTRKSEAHYLMTIIYFLIVVLDNIGYSQKTKISGFSLLFLY